jgi:hypothetical protein
MPHSYKTRRAVPDKTGYILPGYGSTTIDRKDFITDECYLYGCKPLITFVALFSLKGVYVVSFCNDLLHFLFQGKPLKNTGMPGYIVGTFLYSIAVS